MRSWMWCLLLLLSPISICTGQDQQIRVYYGLPNMTAVIGDTLNVPVQVGTTDPTVDDFGYIMMPLATRDYYVEGRYGGFDYPPLTDWDSRDFLNPYMDPVLGYGYTNQT